jgi:hypothetical protein
MYMCICVYVYTRLHIQIHIHIHSEESVEEFEVRELKGHVDSGGKNQVPRAGLIYDCHI